MPAPTSEDPLTAASPASPGEAVVPGTGAPERALPAAAALPAHSVSPAAFVAPVQVPLAAQHATPVVPALPPAEPVAPPASVGSRASPSKAAAAAPEPAPGSETAARADEILRQIELHLSPSVKRLTLELEPVELGRLSIQLTLRAGKLAAIVRGERPEALALLEQRAPELARLLSARGLVTDELRFELGFRAPAGARRPRSAPALHRPPAGAAGRVPGSVDTLA